MVSVGVFDGALVGEFSGITTPFLNRECTVATGKESERHVTVTELPFFTIDDGVKLTVTVGLSRIIRDTQDE